MDVDVLLTRARSACSRKTRYELGKGGLNPQASMPWASVTDHSCDCSGFVSWALGISKYVRGVPWYDASHNGEWFNTDAIVRDAKSPFGFVSQIEAAEPGALIVFPRASAGQYGHIGIVSEIGEKPEDMRVIHCSGGNFRSQAQDAIQETDARVFLARKDCIFAWCAFVEKVPVLVG